jgi:hypothetical protein
MPATLSAARRRSTLMGPSRSPLASSACPRTVCSASWKREESRAKAKPELGIQFGAGGSTSTEELEAERTKDVGWLIASSVTVSDRGTGQGLSGCHSSDEGRERRELLLDKAPRDLVL